MTDHTIAAAVAQIDALTRSLAETRAQLASWRQAAEERAAALDELTAQLDELHAESP